MTEHTIISTDGTQTITLTEAAYRHRQFYGADSTAYTHIGLDGNYKGIAAVYAERAAMAADDATDAHAESVRLHDHGDKAGGARETKASEDSLAKARAFAAQANAVRG